MRFKTFVFLCLAGTLFVLPGCGGGGSSLSTQSQLNGTWKAVSISGAGQSDACPASITLTPTALQQCGPDDTLRIVASPGQLAVTFSDIAGIHNLDLSRDNTFVLSYPAVGNITAYTKTYQIAETNNVLTIMQISSTSVDPVIGSDYNGALTTYQKQ